MGRGGVMHGRSTTEHVARERGKVTPGLRLTVWRRDGGRCYLCGMYLGSNAGLAYRAWRRLRGKHGPWHLAHKHAVSRGGLTTLGNVAVACQPCNLRQGTRTPTEYRASQVFRPVRLAWRARWWIAGGLLAWQAPDVRQAVIDLVGGLAGG